ncbi:MAG: hypothetical protein ABEJ05_08845, partial [Haloglomus sp.]
IPVPADPAAPPPAETDPGPDADAASADVPAPTLLTGMLTAVAAGGFVGWALLPLSVSVAGLLLFAVAAVATTLWSGVAFLRRDRPTGVLAEESYLMGVTGLTRPVAAALSFDGLPAFLAQPGAVFVAFIVAIVAAGVLLAAGWRLDTHARRPASGRCAGGSAGGWHASGPRTARSERVQPAWSPHRSPERQ